MMLELQGVTAGYTAVPVLRDVSIRVGVGQLVAVVGPNGAGKSTLFRTISGVLKPSAGTIRFDGVDIGAVPPARRPHLGIAHVPEGRQVFPSLTVMENLELGASTEAGRRAWKENRERIFQWLPRLAERRDQMAGTLSGGEQQMLAVGRGLASAPKLLMLDEPSMGLSPVMADFIFERLHRDPSRDARDRAAGRAARRRGARIRRLRLRARDRPRRARGPARGAEVQRPRRARRIWECDSWACDIGK